MVLDVVNLINSFALIAEKHLQVMNIYNIYHALQKNKHILDSMLSVDKFQNSSKQKLNRKKKLSLKSQHQKKKLSLKSKHMSKQKLNPKRKNKLKNK